MSKTYEHPYIRTLMQQFAEGRVHRREFLRTATLLGLSASAAFGFAGKIAPAAAQTQMPRGGTIRVGALVMDVKKPHTFYRIEQSNIVRQVCEYLTVTGQDNVTRPYLVESWTPSPDLRTWTLKLRKDVKWRKGRPFLADDAIWNFKFVMDEANGSSMLSLFKAYLLEEYDAGAKDAKGNPKKSVRLWDANALEKVDDHTIRLNLKKSHLSVPEDLFAYPFVILDPEENGTFGVGSNGTGPFELVEHQVGRKAVLRARSGYWGKPANIDQLEFIDLGEDAGAGISALVSRQIHGLTTAGIAQYQTLRNVPHLEMHLAKTGTSLVLRGKNTEKPFDDVRVRKALQLSIDTKALIDLAYQGLGDPGEGHPIAPIHPDYAPIPPVKRDVAAAKKLLAEAGYPNGIDLKLDCRTEPDYAIATVQGVVEQCKEAGIRLTLNTMPPSQYMEIWLKTPFGVTEWFHRTLGLQVLALAYRSGVQWNEAMYSNPEFDKLLAEAEATVDVPKRREIFARMEKILQDDAPAIPFYFRSSFTFYDKKVKGFKMHPGQYIFANELAVEA